ncbi:MAG: Na+/H+ antiporter NhaC family protein [Oscillospiraceae bacterium]|jgi:tetracycline resistance efflux pump|nr:Na+/H+ antiporter NhaC family protein [Oscillospiraceae bacterium]MCI9562265.1 Na+/H+ antiporter NhaC family protein [Oscillospiraceae bacterium]
MRTPRTRRVLTLALAGAACLALTLTAFAAGGEAAVSGMYATFWALVPPVVAIVLALITKEAYSSLFIGVLVGALFQCGFAPVDTLDTMLNQGFVSAIEGNAGIFLFLVLLGIIVALVNASGGSAAFGRWAQRNIRTRVGASLATFVLGILIFIDDYFNCLTVGSVMRPVTDGHRISRPKLAYLIDATAAPVCMIAPVSSWAAAVSGVAADLDTGVSGIELFIQAIPYNFYSLLTFVFIISLAVMRFDYGPMQLCEQNAREKGELAAVQGSDDGEGNPKGRVVDLIIPVVILFVLCTVGMIYVGGFFGVDAWGGTENAGSFIGAFGNTDAFIGLPWGGIVALVLIVAYVVARRVLTFKEAMACVPKGFVAMVPPITILTLAVSLKNMTNLLGADVFVQNAMEGASQGLYSLLPAVIFIVACLLAFASGTSWGTFGILIPIVVSVFEPSSTLLTIGISACLAGAVCGDHCSPISDTTIMASAGAQCDHVTHVSTQLPYAVTVAAVSFVTFILAGFVQNAVICLIVGAVLTVGTLLALRSMNSKRA